MPRICLPLDAASLSNLLIGLLGVAALLAVLFVRVPIAVGLALVGVCGYAAIDGWRKALVMMGSVPFELASAYSLSVVPLFILMGALASRAGMSRELFDAANAIFSGWRGALTHATIGACAAFGAICGSSIATAATFSKVAIPEMRRHGYQDGLAAGSVAAAGTLGILIPPSVILAIYSLVAEQSLPKLFAAALFPASLLAALYIVVVVWIARLRPHWTPKVPAMPLSERLRAAHGAVEARGAFLPGRGGHLPRLVLAHRGSRHRRLCGRRDRLCHAHAHAARLRRRAPRHRVLDGDALLHHRRRLHLLALHRAHAAAERARRVGAGGRPVPLLIVAAVVLLYFLLGTFLEEVSTLLITVPVILPLMASIGYDGVWFGIFVTVMATIGLISPPVGLTVFVIQAQNPEIPAARIYLGTLPFLVADFVLVGLLIAFPALALWLPAVLRV